MPLDSLLNGWVHDDGTVCPEYLADLPPAGVTWWCTTHQQHVHRPDADRAAGMVAAIRERWSKVAYVGMKPKVVPEAGHQPEWLPDVPRLLAAVEAVLALASTWEHSGRGRVAAMAPVHVERRACGAELRALVTRELTGEDGSDAS